MKERKIFMQLQNSYLFTLKNRVGMAEIHNINKHLLLHLIVIYCQTNQQLNLNHKEKEKYKKNKC